MACLSKEASRRSNSWQPASPQWSGKPPHMQEMPPGSGQPAPCYYDYIYHVNHPCQAGRSGTAAGLPLPGKIVSLDGETTTCSVLSPAHPQIADQGSSGKTNPQ